MKNEIEILITKFTLSVLAIVLEAFVLVYMWRWFVIPLGLPAIHFVHAIGLRFTLAIVYPRTFEQKDYIHTLANVMVYQLIGLGFGYFVHLFM